MKKHTWIKKQAQQAALPNYGKKYIGKPFFLKLIGDVKNKKVLELGSGNGYWLELLRNKGAQCTGIELSRNQIEIAKNKNHDESIFYIQGNITQLEKTSLKANSFDIILLNHVLLEIKSIIQLRKIFKSAYSLLKKNGILVISDLHPFAPSLKPENIKTNKNYHYFKSADIIEVISKRIDGDHVYYRDFHWTLSDIIESMTQFNFKIVSILEPKPSRSLVKKIPYLKYREEIPMSIMIKAIK